MKIPLNKILVNPEQPRQNFNQEELLELASSMRINGLIQPIVVEEAGDQYILHDGERRTRAARINGWAEIEAAVVPGLNGTGKEKRLVRALVANIQRSDLSPIEEAKSFKKMKDQKMSDVAIAHLLGVSTPRITGRLKLLQLEDEIQDLVNAGMLPVDPRVTDALLSIENKEHQVKMARRLARPGITIKGIQMAVTKFNQAVRAEQLSDDIPSLSMAKIKAGGPLVKSKWNALASLNKLPPWEILSNAIERTCQGCSLSDMASKATCSSCPLVELMTMTIQAVNSER